MEKILDAIVIAVFTVVSILLVIGVREARRYRTTGTETHLRKHRLTMKSVFFFVVAGVLILEIAIRLNLIHSGGHEFFWVHLVFAVPFFTLLTLLSFWKDGIRAPKIHKRLGYLCLFTFVCTLVTGLIFLLA